MYCYCFFLAANIDYEFLVAGDISMDGSRILLRRGKNDGAYMWARNVDAGQTVEEALTRSVDHVHSTVFKCQHN